MSLYAYAVIDSAGAIDPVPGLFGAPAYSVSYRQIGVVVSDLGIHRSSFIVHRSLRGAERALEHSAVTDSLMADFTVLPIRFGTVFPSSDDLIVKAEECYADFCSNLKRLRGKVEFGLRVIWPGEAIRRQLEAETRNADGIQHSPTSVSREFLDAKLVRYRCERTFEQRAEQEIAAIDHAFHRSVAEKRYERLQTPNLLLSAYYLVERVLAGDFRAAYERLRRARSDLKYLISGPWPPYSFCHIPAAEINRSSPIWPTGANRCQHPQQLVPSTQQL